MYINMIQFDSKSIYCLLSIHRRFRKIDSTLSGWKTKVEDSEKYKKTVSSFNEGGKKASASISHTATNIRLVYTCICINSIIQYT